MASKNANPATGDRGARQQQIRSGKNVAVVNSQTSSSSQAPGRADPQAGAPAMKNRAALALLANRFPQTFPSDPKQRRPLKVGIAADLAVIFINNNKNGSDSDTVARDSAVVCSIHAPIRRADRRHPQGTDARRPRPPQRTARRHA
jgi:hypothetical protein